MGSRAKKQAAQVQFSQVYGKHKAAAPAQIDRELARLKTQHEKGGATK